MESETEARPEEREEEEEEAPEEEEAQVEEPPPPPKPKRVRPSRAKVVVPEVIPEVKKMGRPKKPPGAPKAKYTARKLPPEPVFDQPPPERLVPSQMEPGDVVAMTRFMAEQIGSLQKTSFDTKREGWRNLVAGMYQ